MEDIRALIDRVKKLESDNMKIRRELDMLRSIPQLKSDATINDVIISVNKITNSIKRKI